MNVEIYGAILGLLYNISDQILYNLQCNHVIFHIFQHCKRSHSQKRDC